MKLARWAVWLLDEALDSVPLYEDGRWYRYGQWGCRLRLWRFWWKEADPRQRPDKNGWIAAPTFERNEK